MSFLKSNPWIFSMIRGFVALISFFTPTAYDKTTSDLILIWINQLAVRIPLYSGPLTIQLLRNRLSLNLFSFACEIIIFSSAIILITITNFYRKSSRNYQKLKRDWLLLAILIMASSLIWIIMKEVFYSIEGASHWENYRPCFGIIGPFIGSGFTIAGFFILKGRE